MSVHPGTNPSSSSCSDPTGPDPLEWEPLADEVLAVFAPHADKLMRKFSDQLYGDFIDTVQDYLADNAKFNIAQRLESSERGRRAEWERASALERQVRELQSTLRLIASQNKAPSNSDDKTHENYLRCVLIDLAKRAVSDGSLGDQDGQLRDEQK